MLRLLYYLLSLIILILCKDYCIFFISEYILGEIWVKRREILLILVNRSIDYYGGVIVEKSFNKYCCFGGNGGCS